MLVAESLNGLTGGRGERREGGRGEGREGGEGAERREGRAVGRREMDRKESLMVLNAPSSTCTVLVLHMHSLSTHHGTSLPNTRPHSAGESGRRTL